MSNHPSIDPHVLVIFGASGDLAKRKLVPAVFELFKMGYLPDNFALLGCSRTDLTDEDFRKRVVYDNEHLDKDNADESTIKGYADKLFYQDISSYTDAGDIKKLHYSLQSACARHRQHGQSLHPAHHDQF